MSALVVAIIVLVFLSALVDAAPKRRRRRYRKQQDDSNGCAGCLIVLGAFLGIGILLKGFDFVKAHQGPVIIGSLIVLFVGLVIYIAYKCNGEVQPPPSDSAKQGGESDGKYAAGYEEVVGQCPSPAEIAGKMGEDAVSKAVWAACMRDGRYFRLLRNVYIEKSNGDFTEIDVLLLHESGVYVFESKNLSGAVYGDMEHMQWKRYKRDGEFDYIPNPIRQNSGHVEALRCFLGQGRGRFRAFSMIVFGSKSKLNYVPDNSAYTSIHLVCNLEIDLMIKMSSMGKVYDMDTIESWFKQLLPGMMLSDAEKQAHVDRVSSRFR